MMIKTESLIARTNLQHDQCEIVGERADGSEVVIKALSPVNEINRHRIDKFYSGMLTAFYLADIEEFPEERIA